MANVKITELTAATALAGTDVLPIVDVGADATKKVSVSDLLRNLPDGSAASPSLAFADDQNTGVLSPGNNSLAFATSGTQRLVIDSSGKIGVGTASPGAGLDVVGNSTMLRLYDGTNTSTGKISQSSDVITLSQAGTSAGALAFATGSGALGTERMRIDGSGRLLVGTSSALDTGGEAVIQLSNTAGARLVLGRNDTSVVAGNGLGGIRFVGNDTTSNTFTTLGEILCQADGTHAAGDNPTRLTFKTTADGASSMTERLRIDSSGRVGIGTVPPSYGIGRVSLDLHSSGATVTHLALTNSTTGSGGASNGFNIIQNGLDTKMVLRESGFMSFSTASTERLRIDSSGDVSIGSTSADGRLHVRKDGTGETLQIWQSDLGTNNRNIKLISPSSDSTTEPFTFSTANSFAVQIDASERFRIDSAGRLLVGTSSSRAVGQSNAGLLQVETTDGAAVGSITRNSNDGSGPVLAFGKSRGTSNSSNTVVQSGDNLGLIYFAGADGTDSQTVAARIQCQVDGTPGSNDMPGRLIFSTTADGGSSPGERMRIDSGGNVGIGVTSLTAKFEVHTTANTKEPVRINDTNNTSSHTHRISFRTGGSEAGSVTSNQTATLFNTSSDYRLKENVVDIADGITRVKQLAPKRFNFIADDTTIVDGFLAHEAQAVVPEAVTGTHNEVDDDGNAVMQGMDYGRLTPLLTAALQEAIAKIETLETKVAALEAQ